MTDEEMADKWVKGHTEIIVDEELEMEYIKEPDPKQTFLAGLKAGRPQWHTPDVPTSPINKIVLGYIKDYNTKKLCLVKWNGEWWYDARTWNDKVKVIAWCEIPTFDKEIK